MSEKTEEGEEDNAGAEHKQGCDDPRPYDPFFGGKRLFVELMPPASKHKENAITVTPLQHRRLHGRPRPNASILILGRKV